MSTSKPLAALFGTSIALCLGAVAPVSAETAAPGSGPTLLAEAGRRARARRVRPTRPPPPPELDESEAGDDPEGDDPGPAAAPEADEGMDEHGDDGDDEDGPRSRDEGRGSARSAPAAGGGGALRRSDRLDFDERLIKGQGARSGAIYLFKRTPRELPELVALRTTYRSRIVNPVLGRSAASRVSAKRVRDSAASSRPTPAKAAPSEPTSELETAPTKAAAEEETKRTPRRRKRGGGR